MFKEFVVSKEDLQSPRSSPVDCCNAGPDCNCVTDLGSPTDGQPSPDSGSQWSPAVTTVRNGLTAGMDLICLVHESGQVNISAPPLSPSVDGSNSHSPTSCSSFTFAGKAHGHLAAWQSMHSTLSGHNHAGSACCCLRCKDSFVEMQCLRCLKLFACKYKHDGTNRCLGSQLVCDPDVSVHLS